AEDGIRDGHVTGVQTCALPILYLEAELQDRAGGPAAELFGTSADLEGWSPGAESESQRRRDEWRTLGFTLGPPLMSLFRHRVPEIGRASCRERVEVWGGAGAGE